MSAPSLIGPHEESCWCTRCSEIHLGGLASPYHNKKTALCGAMEGCKVQVLDLTFYDPRASNCDACRALCGETDEQLRATNLRVKNQLQQAIAKLTKR
jgi:hypothetical protein